MTEDMLTWLRQEITARKSLAEAATNTPREVEYVYPNGPVNGHKWDYKKIPDGGHWTYTDGEDCVRSKPAGLTPRYAVTGGSCGCCVEDSEGQSVDLAHVAANDPQDTIARCEAELALLELHPGATATDECPGCGAFLDGTWVTPPGGVCRVQRILASGYRHCSGFNPEWITTSNR